MLKISAVLFLTSISCLTFGQEELVDTLQGNNIGATITNTGAFFHNPDGNDPGFESPKDSGNHLMYASSFWFGAKDELGNLKMAADAFGGEYRDTYPGALKSDGSADAPVEPFADEIYLVSKDDIEYHVANIVEPGYVIPHGILEWPAHGDVSLGLDYQLAPFADLNGNGLYEPEIGEYPEIRGDHAAYMIMNDKAGPHLASEGDPLGIEIHYMFYQYNGDDDVSNTVFINARIINRSSVNYPEFIMSTYMDSNIGYSGNSDDYIGCNPEGNYIFGYNADNLDEPGGGITGYGENPPAVAFMLLNHEMTVAGYYDNGVGTHGTPYYAYQFWNYQHALWANGDPFEFGGYGHSTDAAIPTNFIFPSDPTDDGGGADTWSEVSAENWAGSRRGHMSAAATSFAAGEVLCYDYAVMASSRDGNHLENASSLADQASIIQAFYESQPDTYCDFTLSNPEPQKELEIDVYPNPSTGAFFIQAEGEYTAAIYTVDGRKVYESALLSGTSTIQADLAPGSYILILNQNGALHPTKIIIE
ncbi:MAG: T9SS type A sorting domain-containing protein [Crocinitomix sp.]|nr:T9SS type A sorting domain-containing protein [Crocinitomix sp.]